MVSTKLIFPRKYANAALLVALLVSGFSYPLVAEDKKPAAADAKDDKTPDKTADKDKQAPLPADAHVAQSIQLNGKALNYTATVGTLPVFDKDGKKSGDVVFTAYTVEGKDRPVTFALNGGPGAASVYLNL